MEDARRARMFSKEYQRLVRRGLRFPPRHICGDACEAAREKQLERDRPGIAAHNKRRREKAKVAA